jgi:protein SCO1/2
MGGSALMRDTNRLVPWLLIMVIAAVGLAVLMIPRGSTAEPALAGTILTPKQAPRFALTDQFGRRVSLAQFRGRPVLLTFMQANCTQLCPLVAESVRRTVDELGSASRKIAFVAVSTDPEGDTLAAARRFSRQHGLLHHWYYLVGSRVTLQPVWHAYYLFVAPANAPQAERNAHTSATYLIDAAGRERVLIGGDPSSHALVRDLRILAGLPGGVEVASVPAAQTGHPAPDFALASLTGPTISSRSLRGKTVLVNFWATWCKACRSGMPRLAGWYRRLHARGLVVLGIDQQESKDVAALYARRLSIPYPVLLDQSGDVSARYNVYALPVTVIIGPTGLVESVHFGILSSSFLSQHVVPLLRS